MSHINKEQETRHSPHSRQAMVWDIPTRLFHWSLVALIALLWITGERGETALELHMKAGFAVLALVLFRMGWGFVGSRTARFADFVTGMGAARAYACALRRGETPHHAGHNPLGGLMILALLAFLALQAGTGLFANDDILTEGPLAHLVSSKTSGTLTLVHKVAFKALLGLIALHVSAALFYLAVKRENLIRAMITGSKLLPAGAQAPTPGDFVNPLRAALVLALAAAAVWALVTLV